MTDILRQFVEVGVSSYALPPTESEDQPPTPMHRAIEQYNNSSIANGTMPLKWESVAISMTYFASLLGAFLVLVQPTIRLHSRIRANIAQRFFCLSDSQ